MDNLLKALNCLQYQAHECPLNCWECEFLQNEYDCDWEYPENSTDVIEEAIRKLEEVY